jgi:hypothetical protein
MRQRKALLNTCFSAPERRLKLVLVEVEEAEAPAELDLVVCCFLVKKLVIEEIIFGLTGRQLR